MAKSFLASHILATNKTNEKALFLKVNQLRLACVLFVTDLLLKVLSFYSFEDAKYTLNYNLNFCRQTNLTTPLITALWNQNFESNTIKEA